MAKLNIHAILIDPQNDFCDLPGATLPVTGACADMKRIAGLIDRVGHKLEDIHVTMDSHRLIDIAHPAFWMDQNGKQPSPFTFIKDTDIEAGIWTPRNPQFRTRALAYTKALEATGKYTLCIWPAHCLIGTLGHNIHEDVNAALQRWSAKEFAMVDYVTKGSNPWTEHYGALQAEVPDPSDPGTALNTSFLTMLADADIVAVCGEASSHCVKNTVLQIAENIGAQHVAKFHLISDCMSPVGAVPGADFPAIAKAWLQDMKSQYGMTICTADEFLA